MKAHVRWMNEKIQNSALPFFPGRQRERKYKLLFENHNFMISLSIQAQHVFSSSKFIFPEHTNNDTAEKKNANFQFHHHCSSPIKTIILQSFRESIIARGSKKKLMEKMMKIELGPGMMREYLNMTVIGDDEDAMKAAKSD